MPQQDAVKASSFADSITLRRASSASYQGGTTGSFLDGRARPSTWRSTAEEALITSEPEPTDGAERAGPGLSGRYRFGYLLQYFAVGFIYGGLPATTYGFLKGYLGVPAFVYATSNTVLTLPWSFKFVFGAWNDCVPILGYRRKSYMVIGWCVCTAMLVRLYLLPLPPPFYCIDPDTGALLTDAPPCHPESAQSGGVFTLYMTGACLGYVIADVAADGLTVQYARAEPEESRGRTQTTAYLTRALGQVAAYSLVGFGMNGKEYLGTFDVTFSFSTVCLCFAVMAGLMVPVSLCAVHEARLVERVSLREYLRATWELLRSKAFFYVVLWQFLNPAIQYVSSTATPNVTVHWARVGAVQKQVMNIVGYLLFSYALYVVRERFLHVSWRWMLIVTTVSLYAIDAPFTLLTVFDIVRNQYFFLGETLLAELVTLTLISNLSPRFVPSPDAIFFVVSCFVLVEHASANNEGLVYGLLTTIANVGKSIPNALSNQLFGTLRPALSDDANYIAVRGGDQPCFRLVVALSFGISYAFALASLLTMPLMPDQKADCHHRIATWPHRTSYALVTVAIVVLGLGYSLSVNILALTPLACLEVLGGEGCDRGANHTLPFANATSCS